MPKKIAVIGSNCFSGSDFVDLALEAGYDVIGISRSPEKSALFLPYKGKPAASRFGFFQIDMNRDPAALPRLLDREKPGYVVNFAALSEVAPSWDHPGQWFQTNAVAVAELANHLRKAPYLERYLHVSTPEVYGSCSGRVTENAPLNPTTPYAASKAAGDLMLATLVKNFDFPLVTVRSTNVYGERQQLHKIIPRSIIYLKTGRTIELHGGGQAVKSFIHIRDISRGELAVLERGETGGTYHLSPDAGGISVRELVQKICRLCGADFDRATRAVGERQGQDAAYVIDSTRARAELGWKPGIGLDDGLKRVIDWVNREWPTIQTESLEYVHRP